MEKIDQTYIVTQIMASCTEPREREYTKKITLQNFSYSQSFFLHSFRIQHFFFLSFFFALLLIFHINKTWAQKKYFYSLRTEGKDNLFDRIVRTSPLNWELFRLSRTMNEKFTFGMFDRKCKYCERAQLTCGSIKTRANVICKHIWLLVYTMTYDSLFIP